MHMSSPCRSVDVVGAAAAALFALITRAYMCCTRGVCRIVPSRLGEPQQTADQEKCDIFDHFQSPRRLSRQTLVKQTAPHPFRIRLFT